MGFKENALNDLEKVFFNLNEFAEECSWNKETIIAVIDDDDLIRKYSAEFEVLPQGSHLIYVAAGQFNKMPLVSSVVVFNYNTYTVNEIKNETGMLAIFLGNGRS